ncbi:hypothetical protein GCM10010403_19650 [Glycomyces rutgersensis]|uniref:Uncharacterized protein n=2 Tax=Glycomyces TaxID=58113 RepID=A0A9X3PGM6_9ACTN|nr:hypothetical protein [Glycomyces lechevalierae]MDA1383809.1 hypothetical protein [Glycomyces lechevalierae]MDR7341198.1 hypothetical protein [Glycomyces lechevalierae]
MPDRVAGARQLGLDRLAHDRGDHSRVGAVREALFRLARHAFGHRPVGAVAGVLAELRGRLVLEPGLDDAGLDHDHVDPELVDLHAQRVRERLQGVLGRVVPGAERQGDHAADRGDVHDRAPALLSHVRQDELHEPGRGDHVHLEQVAGLGQRHLLDRAVDHRARVVDQHVDAPLLFDDGGDGAVEPVAVPGVHRERVPAGGDEAAHLVHAPRGAVDDVPGAQQVEGDGVADAGRGARDEADLRVHIAHSFQATGSACTP